MLRRWPHQWTPAAQRDWLVAWLDERPPTVFCELRHLLCALGDYPSRAVLRWFLLLVVLDCRIAHVRSRCRTCRRAEGVPLARIYLRRPADGGECRVATIDPFAPFRRTLALDPPLPAPAGKVNVADVIGARLSDAMVRLGEAGVDVRTERFDAKSFDGVGSMYEALDCGCDVVVKRGEAAVLQVIDVGEAGLGPEDRVVGVCRVGGQGSSGGGHDHFDHAGPRPVDGEPGPREADPVGEKPMPATGRDRSETLQEVNGIGPKIAAKLLADGITIEQVAAMDPDELRQWLPAIQHGRADEMIGSAAEIVERGGGS